MPQGGQEPDGFFARSMLGSVVNALLAYFHYTSVTQLADANFVQLFDDEAVHAVGVVIDKNANLTALVEFQGDGNGTAILAQSGSHFSTTAGNAGTVNLFWHAGSSTYRLENESNSAADFEVLAVRAP